MSTFCVSVCSDEFKGHSLLQAAREADMAKAKKTLALEIINFKHPHTHETALVRYTLKNYHTHRFLHCCIGVSLRFLFVCVCVSTVQ